MTAGDETPYYTNSTHLPVSETDDLIRAVEHQESLQKLYTGGTVLHAYAGERLDAEATRTLVKMLAEKSELPYYTLTPTYSICPDHGYVPGEHFECPHCCKTTEVYSRVVGYYRPVQRWNDGKQEEFSERKQYNV
ncbi:hypothetical protein AKJ47_01175 [candidate division MSBL1 archaeon SCGC-AAA261G05]|uniref:Uncharacterized protein n=3 Tax=candidate division MSBL1 TaxID=215777 RepID=A0A133V0A1_9EURY|nr:hypothetical protein AKJ42_02310 [candidate division MSBL1 archaeon SCGC-AAA261C02]KXB03993.1 hypothetical protein AKJ47_01175 [candidate division MSBL1 archaeon SCGC-AAA261G05]KXB04844.1 hypothetical protein AKJ48_01170 [candidate division MSBL1 archaeon SCGC-AAA261O19]